MEKKKPKVIFKEVSKKYTLQQRKFDRLLEVLRLKNNKRSFYALRNISFTVFEGETIGVIGINGSGKSTMSNLLAQVIPPTTGEINVNGETSLIAIAVGLNNNLTGLENIELKCLMHGMKKEDIKKVIPDIIDFADLGDFIDQPVKNYSSGMKSRLGFAISAHTNPDVLVIDEALSVGDQTFYEKSINKMNEFKAKGKTIFFISHSASQVRSFCDKVIWLHHGELVEYGETKGVLAKYTEFIKWFNELTDEEKKAYKKEKLGLQKKEETQIKRGRSRQTVKEKRKVQNTIWQFAILFTLFIVSAFGMFFNSQDVGGTNLEVDKQSKQIIKGDNSIKEKSITVEKINKSGFIILENTALYKSKEMDKQIGTLNFMEHIFINNLTGDSYEISVGKLEGFVNKNSVKFSNNGLNLSEFTIASFLPAFPESFQSAYEYYLIFLDESSKEIEEKLNGKTDETSDEFGNRYISYGDVTYRINLDGYSDQVIVSNIETDNVDLDELLQLAAFKSEDGQLFYILNQDFEFILNREDNTLIVKTRKVE